MLKIIILVIETIMAANRVWVDAAGNENVLPLYMAPLDDGIKEMNIECADWHSDQELIVLGGMAYDMNFNVGESPVIRRAYLGLI
jgi:hypothetical protein